MQVRKKVKGVSLDGVARIFNLRPITLKRRLKELYGKQPKSAKSYSPFEVLIIAEYFGWKVNEKMFERLFKVAPNSIKNEGSGSGDGEENQGGVGR